MGFIVTSFVNIGFQNQVGPYNIWSKILMIMQVIFLIFRTFFFFKLFPSMTSMVVMLDQVI